MTIEEISEHFDKSETTNTRHLDEYRETDFEFMTREQFIRAVQSLIHNLTRK